MKKCAMLLVVLLVFVGGCQQSVKLDNLNIGMPLADVQSMTQLEKVAEDQDNVVYRCWVEGGVKSMLRNGSVLAGNEPYLLKFTKKDSKLVEMKFDGNAPGW